MNYRINECPELGEKVYEYKHPSGLDVLFAPKEGYFEKYAMFSVNYGSVDCSFFDASGRKNDVPAGIAHFLEHKLFEQKDGSVMDKFAALGSSPNAFTSFTQTSYLFSCTDLFDENFRLLMDFVQNPYITEESVEKEKGIIGQEINMYKDSPNWVTIMNFLGALYHNNPVRIDIAGSIESISQINTNLLYLCYNSFYRPENMVIAVAGDLDPEYVFDMVNKGISDSWAKASGQPGKSVFETEPITVRQKMHRQKMDVATPMFMIGYKDDPSGLTPVDAAVRKISMKILLEILFGRSSDFYEKYYSQGLINDSFYTSFESERGFAFSSFGGESERPEDVLKAIRDTVNDAQKNGIDKEAFTRVLNNYNGSYIKRFNSVENICRQYTASRFTGVGVFDYFNLYGKITLDDVNKVLNDHFIEERLSIAITDSYR